MWDFDDEGYVLGTDDGPLRYGAHRSDWDLYETALLGRWIVHRGATWGALKEWDSQRKSEELVRSHMSNDA